MANPTKCLTNGAIYHTRIQSTKVSVSVDIPFNLDITEKEAEILETLLHNQLEIILRPYFKPQVKEDK